MTKSLEKIPICNGTVQENLNAEMVGGKKFDEIINSMSTFIEDLNEKTALVDDDLGVIADSEAGYQNKKVKKSSLLNWIKTKLFNSSSIKLKNYARVVLNPNAFTNGVANERVNIKIPIGDGYGLSCQIKVKGSADFSNGNTMGILEKTYNFASNGSSFWLNIGSYTQIDGAISEWVSFGDISSYNGYFVIPIIKRGQYTDVLRLTIILEFEGLTTPSDAMIDGICSGGVYISSEPIPSENRLGTKGYNVLDSGHMGAGSGLDADKWDNNEFADFLNQAVRTTDEPTFNQLTLSYPADNDFEAVRADKEIIISTYSDNGALQVNGGTERTRKMTQSLSFILSLVQGDIELGQNTNGMSIQNGIAKVLGADPVKIDLPQRIDQDSDFNIRTLDVGKNNVVAYSSMANGKDAYARNVGEKAMCSGNGTFSTFADVTKANTCDVHQEGLIKDLSGDLTSIDLQPTMDDFVAPPLSLKEHIDFNYGFSESMKHIGYELNIILDFVNSGNLYESCSLNIHGNILIDADGYLFHVKKQDICLSSNYVDNSMLHSMFRDVDLIITQYGTPLDYCIKPKLRIGSLDITSDDWFGNAHTSQTEIGDGTGLIISSWKWEFNVISSATKYYKQVKKK